MARNEPRYIAHFTPETWIRDQAVEVDAPGPQEWDATAYARQHLEYLTSTGRRRGERLSDPAGVLDNDDVFLDDPAAPEWVRTWQGPFTIRVRTEDQENNDTAWPEGKTLGELTPAQRQAATRNAASRLQAELAAAAPGIARMLAESEDEEGGS